MIFTLVSLVNILYFSLVIFNFFEKNNSSKMLSWGPLRGPLYGGGPDA